MARKKQTSLQKEFQKQRQRLRQSQRRAEKKGYVFDDNIIPDMPKRVTKKSLEKIKNTKTSDLYKKAVKLDTNTGEIVKATQARKQERQEAYQLGRKRRKTKDMGYTESEIPMDEDFVFENVSKIIIANFKMEVSRYPNTAEPLITSWLNNLLSLYSQDDVAQMLQDGRSNGLIITYEIAYNMDKLTSFVSEMMEWLPEASEGVKQEIIDAFEMNEDWSEPI